MFSKEAQKVSIYWGNSSENMSTKTFKNRPIWSHCVRATNFMAKINPSPDRSIVKHGLIKTRPKAIALSAHVTFRLEQTMVRLHNRLFTPNDNVLD